MKNALQKLTSWMRLHPVTIVFFAFIFGVLSAVMGFREDWLIPKILFGGFLVLLIAMMWRWGKTTVTVITLFAWLMATAPELNAEPPKPPQREFLWIAVAIVVVVVGAVVIVKTVTFCERKFPKETKKEKNEDENNIIAVGQYAASFNYEGECEGSSSLLAETPTTFYISAVVNGTNITINRSGSTSPDSYQTLSELQQETANYGVYLTPNSIGEYYAYNSNSIPAWASPIQFNANNKTVKVSNGSKRVRIERSENMNNWEHLVTVEVPDGNRIEYANTTEKGQQFYRLTLSE